MQSNIGEERRSETHKCSGVVWRSAATDIEGAERVIKKTEGEWSEVRASPGLGRVRVQIDSGAIDTVGPKEIAKAFEVKETEMPKRRIGQVAASGSSIES